MSGLPIGTVTYLFTDVEGSTRLWEQSPRTMDPALARHDALVEEVVQGHGGALVRPRGEGDSRFAIFARGSDAVAAAVLQRALHAEPWPTPTPLRVRMGLHTGEAELRVGDYYGGAVNRCARLRAAAHGGQTLLSQATHALVREQPPAGVTFRDLGEHRLKDLAEPERVYQLVVAGLPVDFPPLLTFDRHLHNLPVQRDPLIAREEELRAVAALLRRADASLVTLSGPAGAGKTRLALQVAAELADAFPDGVFFVPPAAVRDPGLVAPAIAQVLGVREAAGRSLIASLQAHLRDQQVLLLLDNFEQVAQSAALVAELLAAAPRLKMLVTSRAVLRLQGEQEYPLPPSRCPIPGAYLRWKNSPTTGRWRSSSSGRGWPGPTSRSPSGTPGRWPRSARAWTGCRWRGRSPATCPE